MGYTRDTRNLVHHILLFARKLREKGLALSLSRILGAVRGLKLVRIEDREEVYILLYTHFVSRPEEAPIFDSIFDEFWSHKQIRTLTAPRSPNRVLSDLKLPFELVHESNGVRECGHPEWKGPAYSAAEELSKRDFSELADGESEEVLNLIMALTQNLGQRLGRRFRSGRKGERVDLRGSLRTSLGQGGELLVLRKRRRRPRKNRFVVLCDVSGSMDCYARFLFQFLYGFQRHVPHVETFVFSTKLTRITPLFRLRKMSAAYRLISEEVTHWSGGTRIGSSLAEYNRRYGGRYSCSNTTCIFLSDGWDQGETELLERELKILKTRVKRLIWLNPLLGMPGYRPIDRGMRTALPFADKFLDCHDLDQLEVFGRRLEETCAGS
ncbi:MAG: VWA domain-containing protein [Thermodesulfobacteriota bacterium]